MDWLQQVLDGSPDQAAIEHMRRGLRIWLNSGRRAVRDLEGRRIRPRAVALSRCLGLADNPDLVRKRIRDEYLRMAAQELQRSLPLSRSVASALCDEATHFSRHRWLCWFGFDHPPPNVSELERLLFFAMKAGGGTLPGTRRQYANILAP